MGILWRMAHGLVMLAVLSGAVLFGQVYRPFQVVAAVMTEPAEDRPGWLSYAEEKAQTDRMVIADVISDAKTDILTAIRIASLHPAMPPPLPWHPVVAGGMHFWPVEIELTPPPVRKRTKPSVKQTGPPDKGWRPIVNKACECG